MNPPISPGAPPAWAVGEYPKSCRIALGCGVVARLLCACHAGSLSKRSVRSAAAAAHCAATAATMHATHCVLRRHPFIAPGDDGWISELERLRMFNCTKFSARPSRKRSAEPGPMSLRVIGMYTDVGQGDL